MSQADKAEVKLLRQRCDELLAACKLSLDFIDAVNCEVPDHLPLYKQSAVASKALQAVIARNQSLRIKNNTEKQQHEQTETNIQLA